MASGKLHVEVEVKSHADKIWESLRDFIYIYPKAFPNDYKSVEVLEGDGIEPGSVRFITYGEGSPIVKVSKERIEVVDPPNKTFSYGVIDGDLLKYYKSFKAHVTVISKEEGSLVKWSCEFEKASDDIPDPSVIKDFAAKNFKELDDYISKQT
ncbi:Bet v I type allergen [Parasponia andersonii]|uniref:Bet v I type allergen n=1 Tax=Parasponia andersonii TaxID=3476 RepID=A0A2P5A549_PARAD|nr:Bet v I type allergen [Parasponia andersonii]